MNLSCKILIDFTHLTKFFYFFRFDSILLTYIYMYYHLPAFHLEIPDDNNFNIKISEGKKSVRGVQENY